MTNRFSRDNDIRNEQQQFVQLHLPFQRVLETRMHDRVITILLTVIVANIEIVITRIINFIITC